VSAHDILDYGGIFLVGWLFGTTLKSVGVTPNRWQFWVLMLCVTAQQILMVV
jgi:hypothetical protein